MSYHSKYDVFWLKNIDALKEAIKTAYTNGITSIDISEISGYGRRKRESWYGKIVICGDKIVNDSIMVHLKSLGRIILGNNLLYGYNSCFSFTVTKDLVLIVKRLDYTVHIKPSTAIQTDAGSHIYKTSNVKNSALFDHLFRDKPLGPRCRCDYIFEGFYWHELATLKASHLPRKPGVYVIRVIEKRDEPINARRNLEEIILRSSWDELIQYVSNRLARLLRIGDCPLLYIGSTDSIKSRFKDLAGVRHTAFFPILALLLSNWRLDYGFKTVSTKEELNYWKRSLRKNTRKYMGTYQHLLKSRNRTFHCLTE